MFEGLLLLLILCLLCMAKVQGPLLSLEARGKIADAIVFFPWKGRHVVRQWLKPANPQSQDQGDQRLILGGLGRGTAPIHTTSVFATDIRLYMATGNTWVAEMVQYMIKNVVNDGTAWDVLVDEWGVHPSKALFTSKAGEINIHSLYIPYAGAGRAALAGMILYCVAKCVTNWELLGTKGFQRAPYTKALYDWIESDIDDMITEFAAA